MNGNNIKMTDLPELDRPREKALHFGINKLSNIELLALIIGSGGKDHNALMIATSLLAKAHSIQGIINLHFDDYLEIDGIKKATAFRFLAIGELIKRQGLSHETINFTDIKSVALRYRYIIGNNKNESMYLIAINDKGMMVFEKELYIGTSHTFVSSENEIISELKKVRAHFFLLVHNHPSNNINPSEDDLISTNHLKVMAKRNNLILLDHLIVCEKDSYYSFKEHNKLIH